MRAAIALALAGCWTSASALPAAPDPSPPPPATAHLARTAHHRSPCEDAIEHALDVAHDVLTGVPPEIAEKLPQALIDSCIETAWSEDTLRCFDESSDPNGLGQCQSQLTPEQATDIMKRLTDLTRVTTP